MRILSTLIQDLSRINNFHQSFLWGENWRTKSSFAQQGIAYVMQAAEVLALGAAVRSATYFSLARFGGVPASEIRAASLQVLGTSMLPATSLYSHFHRQNESQAKALCLGVLITVTSHVLGGWPGWINRDMHGLIYCAGMMAASAMFFDVSQGW